MTRYFVATMVFALPDSQAGDPHKGDLDSLDTHLSSALDIHGAQLVPCTWAPDLDTICDETNVPHGTLTHLDFNQDAARETNGEFAPLSSHLDVKGISYTIENTGGGCMVMFVPTGDKVVTITREDENGPNGPETWLATERTSWELTEENQNVLVDFGTTDQVMEALRSRLA